MSVLPLYLAMATALGFIDLRIRTSLDTSYTKYVPAVLAGQEPPPAKYRVLAPYVYDKLQHALCMRPDNAWALFRWLCLVAALCAGHLFFRTWFSTGATIAGNAIVAILLPLTFTNSWGHPDDLMELFLFTLGCACLARGWYAAFLAVLAAAAFNRETSFLLVLLFAVAPAARLTAARVRALVVPALVWAFVYVGLRYKLGYVAYDPLQVSGNLSRLFTWPSFAADRDIYYRLYGWFFVILLLAPLAIIVRGWRTQPPFLRGALAIAVPLFVAIGVVFSSVMEPRIFTPLLPLLAAGVLATVFVPEAEAR